MKEKLSTLDLVILGLMGALLYLSQIILAPFPNIEVISFLIIVYTVKWRWKVFYPIYLFVMLQGITYGFGVWWWSYLYVWSLLALIVLLFQCRIHSLGCAILGGFFGLFFGALTAIPYLFIGGPTMAFSWWISGIPFDLIHCVGNAVVGLILWNPISRIFRLPKIRYDSPVR